MFESKSKINEQAEREKDLTSSLQSAIDRLNKAEKEVAHLSEGGSSGQRERDRLQDLCVSLQKQVRKCVHVCMYVCACVCTYKYPQVLCCLSLDSLFFSFLYNHLFVSSYIYLFVCLFVCQNVSSFSL